MRIGSSPNKKKLTDYHSAQVTICVLIYIPDQIGYYAHRLDVLKLCLESITKHTITPYDLLVLDNGSSPEVVEYLRSLRDQGIINYLILSNRNLGKYGALKIMFNAAPGEVIAYCDDDVLFYPGWLQEHLKVLDTFPRVGMVSGVAPRRQFRYGNKYLPAYLSDFREVSVKYGRFIPDRWEIEHFLSVGDDPQEALEETRIYEDIVLNYKDLKVYSTAVHFQYVALKRVILKGLTPEWDGRLMDGTDVEIDERIDALGYARVSTFQRYVRHIGNVITPDLETEISRLGLGNGLTVWTPPKPFLLRMARLRIVRRILQQLYNWSYFLLRYKY